MFEWSTLPDEIQNLFERVFRAEFYPVLVGGIVRDYLLTKKWGDDFDIELRSDTIPLDQWEKSLESFYQQLSKDYNIERFDFHICKIALGRYSIEFSSPRLENYLPENYSHKNFTASFFPKIGYKESFKRRDFSINAIGLIISEKKIMTLIDPYKGVEALKNKKLEFCSEDFFKDPVRFLRMIRFKVKFNLMIGDDLFSKIGLFHLESLTSFYFLKEWLKSYNYNEYLKLFFELKKCFKLSTNEKLKIVDSIGTLAIDSCFYGTLTSNQQLYLLILIEKKDQLDRAILDQLGQFFEIKQKDRIKFYELVSDLTSRVYLSEKAKHQRLFPSFMSNRANLNFLGLLEAKFAVV